MSDYDYDLARECYCTCHIGPKRMLPPEFPTGELELDKREENLLLRMQCTLDTLTAGLPPDTCETCGRSGADRYIEIPDLLGANLMMRRRLEGAGMGVDLQLVSIMKQFRRPSNIEIETRIEENPMRGTSRTIDASELTAWLYDEIKRESAYVKLETDRDARKFAMGVLWAYKRIVEKLEEEERK